MAAPPLAPRPLFAQPSTAQLLFEAATSGNVPLCRELIQCRANPNEKHNDATPLFAAAEQGFVDVCRLLLESNADPKLCGGPMLQPAFTVALARGHKDVCDLLASVSFFSTSLLSLYFHAYLFAFVRSTAFNLRRQRATQNWSSIS